MDQKITFRASKGYLKFEADYPKPIKINIPEWFKKINHNHNNVTIKGCIPFLQSLTTGYILSLPQDFHLEHNSLDKNSIRTQLTPNFPENNFNLNSKGRKECHATYQVKGSPALKKNNFLPVQKILNPWIIKTPPGYSCLFVPPLNNADDRFSIIPAIVDTDTFAMWINFPFVVNGDKYPVLDTELKKGTPYVQIIPFKRDSWKMKKEEQKEEEKMWLGKYFLKKLHNYKQTFWNKNTTWK